jgi:hypothetical protein
MRQALVLSFLMLAPALVAQTPRTPRGVYTVVNVEDIINQNPTLTPAQLDSYFGSFYQGLLADPAISGLTLQVHWDTLNPNAPPAANAYFWNYVDDAFTQASSAKKTIQLIATPGFQSPQWVLDQIPPCDVLFQSQTPPSTCGTATFVGFAEGGDGTVLPLPWNPFYKSSWQTFLTALAARYGSNPAFVSIAVAGPTAASAEMILPNNGNTTNPQTAFGEDVAPTDMWRQLLAFHYPGMAAYQNSDQAFIDAWEAAIDMYGEVFSGVTLVATTGDGLPSFNNNVTIPPGFGPYCGTPNMDCAAETTILAYFAEAAVGGANAKATQTSGMEASRAAGNLGVAGVKLLSQSTAQFTAAFGSSPRRVAVRYVLREFHLAGRLHEHVSAQRQRHARRVHRPQRPHRNAFSCVHAAGLPRPRRHSGEPGRLHEIQSGPRGGLDLAGAGSLQLPECLL